MALHLAVEEDAVRHRVVEIRIEMEGLVDATRGPGVVAEPQERRAFVAPRGGILAQRALEVSAVERPTRRPHRVLQPIDAGEEPARRLRRKSHSDSSDSRCRRQVARHFVANSWPGWRNRARSYAASPSRYRSSC